MEDVVLMEILISMVSEKFFSIGLLKRYSIRIIIKVVLDVIKVWCSVWVKDMLKIL